MATDDQFPKAPPLRFELTEEQAALVDAAKSAGDVALVVGYAQRHPWPEGADWKSTCHRYVESSP